MDGKISVESLPGKGSTFFVELPTGEVGGCMDSAPDIAPRYILLYIEDSRTNVNLVAQILKARPNIALMSANTGEMGLKLAHMHRPDIILLDINLPGIDGYEVLAQLKNHENTQNIPVLGLSAMDTMSSVAKAEKASFLTYIVKPLDIKKFLDAVDMALDQSLETES